MGKMGVEMARATERRGGLLASLVILLSIAVVGAVMEGPALADPVAPDLPPALDRVLDRADHVLGPRARILVVGLPPGLVWYRATAALYPRRVYTAVATDFAHAWAVPPLSWRTLADLARRDGARYLLLWRLPRSPRGTRPRGAVRLRAGGGLLLELAS